MNALHPVDDYQDQKTEKARQAEVLASADDVGEKIARLADRFELLNSRLGYILRPSSPATSRDASGKVGPVKSQLADRLDSYAGQLDTLYLQTEDLISRLDI
ncbi:MAG: hypothetical protein JNJ51_06095 [Methylobacillus glycogenes]|nr:hypothetical protein [Methylobacillus glycogenes]